MIQIDNRDSEARSSVNEDEFVLSLVAANQRCRSWLEKLVLASPAGENDLLTTEQWRIHQTELS